MMSEHGWSPARAHTLAVDLQTEPSLSSRKLQSTPRRSAFIDQEFRVSISPPPAIAPMAVVLNWQAALKK
jgi:hypothetical protein